MVEKIFEAQVSYVVGIASIIFAFLSPIYGILLGVVGLLTIKKQKDDFSKKAIKLNKIGIFLGVVVFIVLFVFIYLAGTYYPDILAQIQGQI